MHMPHKLPLLLITLLIGACTPAETLDVSEPEVSMETPSDAGAGGEVAETAGDFAIGDDLYVITTMADEMLGPSDAGQVMGQLYKKQIVTVFDISGDWVRVNEKKFSPRWIKASSLAKKLD